MNDIICHCFGYTRKDIRDDIEAHGISTIMQRIIGEKKNNVCRCAERHPRKR
ncbi:(2Fe-2S)-binding protein [Desulfonema ishimotonii]|uniref:(2Fe-2S)-binding protein n=1 Tax=Desulfonema ishimotonii TaxID=45657 RepID=UPI000F5820D4|nr:(2Fe-2S)-binding protein [Desulfonema ishimotonii]